MESRNSTLASAKRSKGKGRTTPVDSDSPTTITRAQQLIISAEKDLDEYYNDVTPKVRSQAVSAMAALKQALDEKDKKNIAQCYEALCEALQNLGDATYEDLQQESSSADMETQNPKDQERDVEKSYSKAQFVAKLRRLADAIESGKRFTLQIDGERIYVPAKAHYNIEHEREENQEEIEFQIKWDRESPR